MGVGYWVGGNLQFKLTDIVKSCSLYFQREQHLPLSITDIHLRVNFPHSFSVNEMQKRNQILNINLSIFHIPKL